MNKTPIEIKRIDNRGLDILWQDGQRTTLTSDLLRRNCPCASCREARGDGSHNNPLYPNKSKSNKPKSLAIIEHSAAEALRLEEVWAVGNYALGVRWGDGHNTGIFTFDQLIQLSTDAKI